MPATGSPPGAALACWVERWRDLDFPVLAATAELLEALRAREDDVDANQLGDWFAGDPLMTLKVLRWASSMRDGHPGRRAETVTGAIVLTGIGPFFRGFGAQPTVEGALAGAPPALEGFRRLQARVALGAELALAFAVHRADPGAAMIHAAASLHEFAEMLLWCLEPRRALAIAAAQAADPTLRSQTAQADALGIDLRTLQRALIEAWHLPTLVDTETARSERPLATSGAQTVDLATRLARHLDHGWSDAALPDDIADVATLLNVAPGVAESLVRSVAAGLVPEGAAWGAAPSASANTVA